ncbi:hypothetical protein ACHQM5_020460 [Ranunculus cassubicifolius]
MIESWNPWKYVVTCRPQRSIISRGIWLDDNPFDFSTPAFMVQIALASFVTGIVDFILRPLGICSFFSHMVGALLLGPTMLGRYSFASDKIFSSQSQYVLETFQNIGVIFFLFLVGLKMDVRIVSNSGRKALLIGVSAGLVPLIITFLVAALCKHFLRHTDPGLATMLPMVASIESQSNFHAVTCLLADLKMLNSEVGRLAIASAIVSNACSWSVLIVLIVFKKYHGGHNLGLVFFTLGSLVAFLLAIVYVLRPMMCWMIKQIPQGTNNMKELHVFIMFFMVLLCAFLGQLAGHPPGFGPLLLGLAVPPGPPLAETIEDKLESIIHLVLIPLFYVAAAGGVVTEHMDTDGIMVVELLFVLGSLGKIVATILPSIHCGIPLRDALVLGLLISSQGLVDVTHIRRALVFNNLNAQVYTLLIYSALGIAGVTSVLVKIIYKPCSTGHLTYRRAIRSEIHSSEFWVLACVHQESNVPGIIDLLESSNPSDENPISLCLLHLIELQRLAPPFLIAHKRDDDSSIYYNRSKHIINAFRFFEQQNEDVFSLHSFTAMSPCDTMHQDICSLAMDQSVSLIILPFHRQFNSDGLLESVNTIRNVNHNVLKMSPCSVGILIDRRPTTTVMGAKAFNHISLIFIGGADDREVLTYGMRMVHDQDITLTVIHFCTTKDEKRGDLSKDTKLDAELLYDFHSRYMGREGIEYREEVVTDGFEIVRLMKTIEHSFDLMMVGRQHGRASRLFKGLSDWNEYPELGFLGDLLATSSLQDEVSILVLQRTPIISSEAFPQSPNYSSYTIQI